MAAKTIERQILTFLQNHGHRSFRAKEIANQLNITDRRTYQLFRSTLTELVDEGLVTLAKRGQYTHRKSPLVHHAGRLRMTPNGYGFVLFEDRKDLYVHRKNLLTALDGDEVRVRVERGPRPPFKEEAVITEVLKRQRAQAVGVFRREGKHGYVRPDDPKLHHDIYVARDDWGAAQPKDKVLVSIDRFLSVGSLPEGRILTVFGQVGAPGVEVEAIAAQHNVFSSFPDEVKAEAQTVALTIDEAEIARRRDLRHLPTFTIDPVDAKDFDDALHVLPLANGLVEIGVHIADVSHYVRPGMAIDAEGLRRATSVYLVDRVIPMLPHVLSNEVCSLRPNEDKLAYSVIFTLHLDGTIEHAELTESVIHSQHRLAYEDAQAILDEVASEHALKDALMAANQIAKRLRAAREAQGALAFEIPELQITLDADGTPIAVKPKERQDAHKLIEEFMLLANQQVCHWRDAHAPTLPFAYRVHEPPAREQIIKLANYLKPLGYKLQHRNGEVEPQAVAEILDAVKGTQEEEVVQIAVLRAMSKARYDTRNAGHFGLAVGNYAHFTSPIRRYPDLLIHRQLKAIQQQTSFLAEFPMQQRCKHCSEREQAAQEAERDSKKLKQTEYMRQFLGEEFDGVICGVAKHGVYVKLDETQIEGLVHVRDMDDDYYEYDERRYILKGSHTGHVLKAGQAVRIVVVKADTEARTIDFYFVET
ncbi:MAG: ribonuclease R [Rhodothermales bacterium]